MDFCLLLKIWVKNIGKNINKNVSGKYGQKLDHAKNFATDSIKTVSKGVIQKTEEATNDLIGNKIADKITRVWKTSPKNNSETNKQEILRGICISPELRPKIFDDFRLKVEN